jgi:hypothetical protein
MLVPGVLYSMESVTLSCREWVNVSVAMRSKECDISHVHNSDGCVNRMYFPAPWCPCVWYIFLAGLLILALFPYGSN